MEALQSKNPWVWKHPERPAARMNGLLLRQRVWFGRRANRDCSYIALRLNAGKLQNTKQNFDRTPDFRRRRFRKSKFQTSISWTISADQISRRTVNCTVWRGWLAYQTHPLLVSLAIFDHHLGIRHRKGWKWAMTKKRQCGWCFLACFRVVCIRFWHLKTDGRNTISVLFFCMNSSSSHELPYYNLVRIKTSPHDTYHHTTHLPTRTKSINGHYDPQAWYW